MNTCPPACRLLLLALLTAIGLAPADAATYIIGGSSLATTEGSTGSLGGGLIGQNNFTAQYQIAASDLSAQGLAAGSTITGVRTRLHEDATMPANRTISDLEITLAQAANSIAGFTTTFASNMSNPVLAHNGAFTFLDAEMPEGSVPNDFGQLVSFTTPYLYQGGDLIFMFSRPAVTGGAGVTTDSHLGDGSIVRAINSNTFHAATGTFSDAFSVLQLQFTPVPEPSRALLFLLGLLFLTGRKTNR